MGTILMYVDTTAPFGDYFNLSVDTPAPMGTILMSVDTPAPFGDYFNLSLDTPAPMGTIVTCLLTHQHPWGLF